MPKKRIREDLLARRRHLSLDNCLAWSLRAQQQLIVSSTFAAARRIALYSSVNNEVFTEEIFAAATRAGKTVTYPRVRENSLEFVIVSSRQMLRPGAFGILEPEGEDLLEVASLDLVVAPGVAFDYQGQRLGYGRGFYDRALHLLEDRAALMGLCFDFQRLPSLPVAEHDVRMHWVVTEEAVHDCRRPPPVGGGLTS